MILPEHKINFSCFRISWEIDLDKVRLTDLNYRYITILYYLNDVEEGGETAFPVADSEGYIHEVCFFPFPL